MATPIAVQDTGGIDGSQLTTVAAATTMEYENDGRVMLYVDNGSGGSIAVTISSRVCSHQRLDDKVINVPAGEIYKIGPFKADLFNDVDGLVQLAIDLITTVTIAAIRVPNFN